MIATAKIDCGLLRITGEDRLRFINGQSTNDIKGLAINNGCYTFFTNNKGKVRCDAVILNTVECLWVIVEQGYAQKLADELEKFLIADDVQIEVATDDWLCFTTIGSVALSDIPDKLFASNTVDGTTVFRSRRAIEPSYDFLVKRSHSEHFFKETLAKLKPNGSSELSHDQLNAYRIEAGIPKLGVDFDENYLAPEVDQESFGISYKKGCYLGQEVIARIKSIGHVNRQVRCIKLPALLSAGEKLTCEGKDIGAITSSTESKQFGPIAIGTVRSDSLNKEIHSTKGMVHVVSSFNDQVAK